MSAPIESISKRLSYALHIRNMKQVDLIEKTGIQKSSISQYLSGYAEPKADRIYIMAKALDVSPVWLLGYDVPMEEGSEIEVPEEIVDEDLQFLEMFKSLSDDDKKVIIRMMENMMK